MNCECLIKDGYIFIEKKQYDLAEARFISAVTLLKIKENDLKRIQMLCEAYNNLGFIYYKKVEFNKAVEYFNESIKLNAVYGTAYYNRGTIYYRLGFYESAVKDMEKAVIFEPDNVEFKTGLEECEFALKMNSIT